MSYSFNKDYSTLSAISIPLNIYNSNKNQILGTTISTSQSSIYTGELGGLFAVPDFLTADSSISDTDFFIDFGDGTIIENNLSAFHSYNTSGNYPITLVVTNSAGSFFRSNNSYIVNITDPVPDKIYLTNSGDKQPQQNESESTVIFYLTRFNNIVTSRDLSANNYKIKLSVDGNSSKFQQEEDYLENKDFQYQKRSFFFTSPDENFKVIDSVETTSDFIYGKLDQSDNLILSTLSARDTILVGTSGYASFRYFEPTFAN
tara:strand:+ start:3930 stop:4709 length:780 start_codon:yes stop_codon:yes gene_type:complete